ncbi:HAMP domain-containing protein [Planomonospora sp. ID91781]|uniref:sensor histidine kinase n=1 Tax=Planomonospora sp. ID91781 TaxID=2738135 RepID=UPI0018C380C0|nr:ATP-binding protein [Planomonospora sp. ID91781]MBG0823133.1 HAMP domain-containing protein [Planomonospora sp. ID91781]
MSLASLVTAVRLRPSIRLRLPVLYTGLVLLAGAAVLAVNYSLVASRLPVRLDTASGPPASSSGEIVVRDGRPVSASDTAQARRAVADSAVARRDRTLGELLRQSIATLAVTAIVTLVAGRLVVGRVLRTVQRITTTARRLSEDDLSRRIGLDGPDDELRELADTFDAMLARLQRAFDEERRLIADIAHELRTPLANQRTVLEVGLGDPGATLADMRRTSERALAQTIRTQQLVERLLLLAYAEHASPGEEPVDLARLARQVLDATASPPGLDIRADLEPVTVAGDPILIEALLVNLVTNAVRHNRADGTVDVVLRPTPDGAELVVVNSGDRIEPEQVAELFQPFRRRRPDRTRSGDGVGLGLPIVAAIASAHGGRVRAGPGPQGGLRVTMELPAARQAGRVDALRS